MHRLLQRQLKRFAASEQLPPADWPSLLAAIDAAYTTADEDLARTERSLELMSNELNERHDNLRAEIAQRQEIEEQLKSSIRRLKRKNEQISQLNSMGDKLQSCRSLERAYDVIADSLQQLFFTQAGVINIHDEASDTLLSVAAWGNDAPICEALVEKNCAALLAENREPCELKTACAAHRDNTTGHLCIQLSTHGQQMGMIQVLLKNDPLERANDNAIGEQEQLVQATSDHISLALANLKLQESLRQQTIHDPLTGLYNRRHMEVSLEREISRAERAGKPLGIMMLDIDHFKRFNDGFGHQAGDAVLIALGAFLNRQVRGEDIACRYGGEEFILILPSADLNSTFRRAEQICRDVPNTLHLESEGTPLGKITISLGVSCYPACGDSPHKVIKAADEALYEAKRSGRNRVVVARC